MNCPAHRAVQLLLVALAACAPRPLSISIDGHREGLGHRVQGKQQGRWTLFRPDGERAATGKFAAGVPVGIWKVFHGNGALQEQAVMHDGVRHGDAATFRADGSRESAGSYEHGQPAGPWQFWAADGTLDAARTGFYRAGVRIE